MAHVLCFFLAYQWLCCVVINYNLSNKFTVCDLVCVGLSMKNGQLSLCSLCLKIKKKKKIRSCLCDCVNGDWGQPIWSACGHCQFAMCFVGNAINFLVLCLFNNYFYH
jgi:hypothetical protein